MRIAVVHGYFLEGTGSNLFVANLSRELCKQGHEVLLFSQEQRLEPLDFVNEAVNFAEDNQAQILRFSRNTAYPGKCRCYRPHLGGNLPVYVRDTYSGYKVEVFPELSREQLEDYLGRNQTALATVFADEPPDLILSNHTIMQPVYVQRALAGMREIPHFVTVHGSCLNFSIRKSPLLTEYARAAIAQVTKLVFVSAFSCEEFLEYFGNSPELRNKATVIPAGVAVEMFRPIRDREDKRQRIAAVVEYLRREGAEGLLWQSPRLPLRHTERRTYGETIWRPEAGAAQQLAALPLEQAQLVLYFGKYLWTKGVHLLIAAAPLILMQHPQCYFILAGMGEFRDYLERLAAALQRGERNTFRKLLEQADGGAAETRRYCQGLLQNLTDRAFADHYFGAAKTIGRHLIFAGYLPHEQLSQLVPCADISVAPSIFTEAFGLVGVEALASGTIPFQTNHSGFAEVISHYVTSIKEFFPGRQLHPLRLDGRLVNQYAWNINQVLAAFADMEEAERDRLRQRLHSIGMEYSWTVMAERYLQIMHQLS